MVLCITSQWAVAGVYKDGKPVSERTCKVAIVKMKWGKSDGADDRLVGTVRRFDLHGRGSSSISSSRLKSDAVVFTFDFFDKEGEVIDTKTFEFTLSAYGYRRSSKYYESPFCIDFPRNTDVKRIAVTSVKIKTEVSTESVTYKTLFNLTASLLRTNFALKEPKAISVSGRR